MSSFALLFAFLALICGTIGESQDWTNPSSPIIVPRWDQNKLADNKTFEDAICRGERFIAAMDVSDEQAGKIFLSKAKPPTMRTPWKDDAKNELKTWGWTVSDPSKSSVCDYDEVWHLKKAFDALKIDTKSSADGGSNICYDITHGDDTGSLTEQKYKVDGREFMKTGGRNQIAVNHKGGAIIVQGRISPAHAAEKNWKRKPKTDELPVLRTLADMLWAAWARDNSDIRNIQYFWAQGVSNNDTGAILATALKNGGKNLGGWPGVTFNMTSEEGSALLGSPSAVAFASLLVSHKKELGDKKITKAIVFRKAEDDKAPEEDKNPEIVFVVEDVPNLMLQLCSRKCCMDDDESEHQPKPLPTSSLSGRDLDKRVMIRPFVAPFDSIWTFMKDMCSFYTQTLSYRGHGPSETSFMQASLMNAGVDTCMPGLYGCTALIVVSRTRVWMAHFVEDPPCRTPSLWEYHILYPIQYGGAGSRIPQGQGLRDLAQPGRDFSAQYSPQAFIVTPKTRRVDPAGQQPETLEYQELVNAISATVTRSLGFQPRVHSYVANAAVMYYISNGMSPESHPNVDFRDATSPYQTPYGKVVFTYDSDAFDQRNDLSYPRNQRRWAGYNIWVADGQQPIGHDEWPAMPGQ